MRTIVVDVVKQMYNPLKWTVWVLREDWDSYVIMTEQRISKKIMYDSKEAFLADLQSSYGKHDWTNSREWDTKND